jgi:hypothetical protein
MLAIGIPGNISYAYQFRVLLIKIWISFVVVLFLDDSFTPYNRSISPGLRLGMFCTETFPIKASDFTSRSGQTP